MSARSLESTVERGVRVSKPSLSVQWGQRPESVSQFADRAVRFFRELGELDPELAGPWTLDHESDVDTGDREAVARAIASSAMRADDGSTYAHWFVPRLFSGDWSRRDAPVAVKFAADFRDALLPGESPVIQSVTVGLEGSDSARAGAIAVDLVRAAARVWQPGIVTFSDRALRSAERQASRLPGAATAAPPWGYVSWLGDDAVAGAAVPGERYGEGTLVTAGESAEEAAATWSAFVQAGLRERPLTAQERLPRFE